MSENKRYKFVVGSAEEAVKVLRERLGENAKVISVRQVEGAGLSKFLRAPKLEVIAQVAPPEETAPPTEPEPIALPNETPRASTQIAEPILPANQATTPVPVSLLSDEPATPRAMAREPEEKPKPVAPADKHSSLTWLLHRAGFSEPMLTRLANAEKWPRISALPIPEALTEIAVLLRLEYGYRPQRALSGRIAFFGTAGTGKTTSLCKQLAGDVFLRQRAARVLKLELDRANPSDGLAVFCDALGVPMTRDVNDLPPLFAPDEQLYIDLPGVNANDSGEVRDLHLLFAEHAITTRVLVVNAAYDSAIIKNAYALGDVVGATHVVFTHCDEIVHWGKLWEFILAQNLTPLFLSAGPNIAGDFSENVFDEVLSKTFPAVGSGLANSQIRP